MRVPGLIALLICLPINPANAYQLTLNGFGTSDLSTYVYDGTNPIVSETVNPTVLPYFYSSNSTVGGVTAETQYFLIDTVFQFTFNHTRTGDLGSFAQSFGYVYFSVDQNTAFMITGSYSVTDANGRIVHLTAYLYDHTVGAFVFNSSQQSQATSNESFTLGLSGGDFSNTSTGSLNGVLTANHDYQLFYSAYIQANPADSGGAAIANGTIRFDLTPELTTVPVDADRFLTYFNEVAPEHAESAVTSAAYHAAIDPNNERLTLDDWRAVNGFNSGADAEAIYVNDADLGFGRHMFVKTHPDGRVASYVKNHTDNTPTGDPVDGPTEEKITNAHNDANLLATVTMEYGPPPGDPAGEFYTRFFAFGADGNRILGADLDGRGEKFIPGVCTACHGGNPRPLLADGSYPDAGVTGAGFLPWDLDTFGFSDTLYGGLPLYNRASQEAVFKTMNQAVLATNPTETAREVIEGWYGGAGTPSATFDGDYVPPGWLGHEDAYLEVYAPNCRACHVMRNDAVAFRSHLDFTKFAERAQELVFDRGIMPLARRTYNRFWTDLSVADPNVIDLFGSVAINRRPDTGDPFAFAGPNQPAAIGLAQSLTGSKSSYATNFIWTLLQAPPGSVATVDDPLIADPMFTPDQAGEYLFTLLATNSQGGAFDSVKLTVTADGSTPGVDFASEILPIFETQCQSCHAGGDAPDFDGLGVISGTQAYNESVYRNLTARVSVIDPEKSVVLQKATNAVAHGGGVQLATDTANYNLLLDWISEGAVRATTASYQLVDGSTSNPIREFTPPFTVSGIHPYSGRDLEPFANLLGANLNSAFLYNADLRNTNLGFAFFVGTNLVGANLSGAILAGADFNDAWLDYANLSTSLGLIPAQIASAASLGGISLANQDLNGIDLSGRFLGSADLSGTDLRGANMSFTTLGGADLSSAKLLNANFSGATIEGANFDNAIGVTVAQIESTAGDWIGATLSNLELAGLDASGRVLYLINLSGTNLTGANLSGVDLTNATLEGTNLAGANLSNVLNLDSTSGSAFYNAITNFGDTSFDPVAAGWTLVTQGVFAVASTTYNADSDGPKEVIGGIPGAAIATSSAGPGGPCGSAVLGALDCFDESRADAGSVSPGDSVASYSHAGGYSSDFMGPPAGTSANAQASQVTYWRAESNIPGTATANIDVFASVAGMMVTAQIGPSGPDETATSVVAEFRALSESGQVFVSSNEASLNVGRDFSATPGWSGDFDLSGVTPGCTTCQASVIYSDFASNAFSIPVGQTFAWEVSLATDSMTPAAIELWAAADFVASGTLSTSTAGVTLVQVLPGIRGDMDGDGKADILWRNIATGENYFYQMNGATIQSAASINLVSDLNWMIVGNGDLNGDGKADLVWRNMASGENYFYLMDGTTIQSSGFINLVSDLNWTIVGNGDMNGDGKADILWRNIATGENYVYLMNGATIQSAASINVVSDQNWKIVGNGDLNGDGKADIVWRNSATGENYYYLMNGATIQSSGFINLVSDLNWKIVGNGDLNGDGKADLVWRNMATGENYYYLMNGATIQSSGFINLVSDLNWTIVGNNDMNGDGKADILWRNIATGENYFYQMNGATIASSASINVIADQNWQISNTR